MTMTNHPYQHPSAGPSYYPGSPVYGSHSPGPRPNFYPYPPPHMPPHPSPQYQHPTPPRGNHRGGHVNGSYTSRGSHPYHHTYHPQPQAPPYHHLNPNSPANGLALSQHPGQQPAKYNLSYSPSYHYPSPNAPVFTPSWQIQSPISPLPKQLSMPPPQNVRACYDSPRVPSTQPSPAQQSPSIGSPEQSLAGASPAPTTSEIPAEVAVPEPTQPSTEIVVESSTQASEPAPDSEVQEPSIQEPSIQLESSLYSQTGTIQISEMPGHLPTISATKPVAQWAIWSRRPQDPSQAPSIIISPKARPPPDVVLQALDLSTPPPSPPVSPPPVQSSVTPAGPAIEKTLKLASDEATTNVFSSQTDSTVPSSAATEFEETPTAPGSPVSSHTSVSVVGTSVKDSSEVQPSLSEAEVPPVTISDTCSSVVNGVGTPSTSDTPLVPVETPEAEDTKPPPTAPVAAVTPQQPIVVDTPPVPPAPKKSWASLLRNPSSPSSLPTSSVVGFSIPATGQIPPHVPVPLSRKSELLNLLTSFPPTPTTGPSTATAGSTSIRPRGLVNNGNMCFANSVLQVLVYCPPFHKLFLELSRLLASDGVSGKDDMTNSTNKTLTKGSTLINATASFLQEFLDPSEKTKTDSISRTGINNSSGSGKGSGKGKEKEFKDEKSLGDNWDESFLPSYVYDVMKTKKRFDTMRGGHQEDAEEFFGFYLDTLEEELLSILHSINPPRQGKRPVTSVEEKTAPPEDDGWFEVGKRNRSLVTRTIKSAESPITRIFGGKVRSTLRASGQKDSVIIEDWRSLRLDIQRDQIFTIQEALSYISHPQVVQVTHSAKPGIIVDAHQQVLIEALPPILVLHIKRFYYDTTVGGVVKVGKHIRYGPELQIPSDLMAPTARKAPTVRYKLFGALYHHGQSASGGHYTLDVLHSTRFSSPLPHAKPREGWVRIDDELVSDVRPDDVFKPPEEDDTRCAYLLFYRRL